MPRPAQLVALLLFFVGLLAPAAAQELSEAQFRTDWNQGFNIQDDKTMDKVMKRGAGQAIKYFEELCFDKGRGDQVATDKVAAMSASWKRCFPNSNTLEQLERWTNGQTETEFAKLTKVRASSARLWGIYTDQISKEMVHNEHAKLVVEFGNLARAAEQLGHYGEAAEQWGLASVVGSRMPDKTLVDRKDTVFAIEQFVAARTAWAFTFDEHFIKNSEFIKFEKVRIAEDEKKNEKRANEGYDTNAKGVDTLVMPNVAEVKALLKFEPLANWDELDYGPKGGPLPFQWWMASTGEVGKNREMTWFGRSKLWFWRNGANKFAVGLSGDDPKLGAVEVEATPKAKPSPFFLDADKKVPYAMFFWLGSEREMVNEAECNMAASDQVANVYYRSAASWKTTIGSDTLTLYDDNASGYPADGDPFEPLLRLPTQGEYDGEGTGVPKLDSMRVGKGPRVPFSEFVKLSTGWSHIKRGAGEDLGMRPLNPEYVKSGKIKLLWNGPKPTAPVQLVVQGLGDYKGAMFDIASGKEVEVPAGEYRVIWGRVMSGKGVRAQVATIYRGESKPFAVEAGQTFVLKMGAPFTLDFTRRGDGSATIHALSLLVREASGCVLTEFHNITLACEVLVAKEADGKGAKPIGKFVHFTDPELVNKASGKFNNLGLLVACWPMPDGYKGDDLVLSLKLPADGMKLGLLVKKHALFGSLATIWR
ncbi:MAG: hypothetical protein K8J09_03645 [Planctomycetes bacterium]|nr:hypothetical protein [Planctomycetota bacterium]MCC7399248.1 hypothetical protein [Planctomycetota bacterium]